jgi:hypothetical protein
MWRCTPVLVVDGDKLQIHRDDVDVQLHESELQRVT